jgi:hypothetical protein
MTADVKAWPKVAGRPEVVLPARMVRPCDWSLKSAIYALETQLGTIEAYNRLAEAAHVLAAKIEAGNAAAQHPMFAVSTGAAE